MNAGSSYKKVKGLVFALLVGIVSYLLLRALDLILASYFLLETKENYSRAWGSALSISAILFNCMVRPLIEEFVFRRKLYGFLLPRLNIWGAMVLTATIFCLAHVELYGTLYMLNTFLMGLVYQTLVNSTGSIVTSATCHGAFNICVLAPKRSVADIQLALGVPELGILWFAGIVSLFAIMTMYILLRSLRIDGDMVSREKNNLASGSGQIVSLR